MRHRLALAAALLACSAGPLVAQAPGVPQHPGSHRPGAELGVLVGFNDDSEAALRGTSYAASFGLGAGRFGLTATAAVVALEEDHRRASLGALGTLHLYGDGVRTPLTLGLFGGFGWMPASEGLDDALRHVPLGISAALTLATPLVSLRPWVAPRVDLAWVDTASADREEKLGFSGGIDLRFPGGLSLRALGDYVDGGSPYVGVGAAYHF